MQPLNVNVLMHQQFVIIGQTQTCATNPTPLVNSGCAYFSDGTARRPFSIGANTVAKNRFFSYHGVGTTAREIE